MVEVQQNGIQYVLNKENHKAGAKLWNAKGDIEIPKSIKHENEDYVIDKIKKCYHFKNNSSG